MATCKMCGAKLDRSMINDDFTITCQECGQVFQLKAPSAPQTKDLVDERYVEEEPKREKGKKSKKAAKAKKAIYKRWWFWLIVVIAILEIAGAAMSGTSTPAGDPTPEPVQTPAPVEETPEPPPTLEETPQPTPNVLDELGIPQDTMIAIHDDIEATFNGPDTPYLNPNTTSEEIDVWEHNVIETVAAKYGISADDAEKIYLYSSYGYIFHYDTNKVPITHGEFVEAHIYGTGIIVKAKIQSSWNNDLTIKQNYYNACDIIRSFGDNHFTELQYWAVADMTDGSEGKVISFTVPKHMIEYIANNQFADNTLGDYVEDLWILPSLLN